MGSRNTRLRYVAIASRIKSSAIFALFPFSNARITLRIDRNMPFLRSSAGLPVAPALGLARSLKSSCEHHHAGNDSRGSAGGGARCPCAFRNRIQHAITIPVVVRPRPIWQLKMIAAVEDEDDEDERPGSSSSSFPLSPLSSPFSSRSHAFRIKTSKSSPIGAFSSVIGTRT